MFQPNGARGHLPVLHVGCDLVPVAFTGHDVPPRRLAFHYRKRIDATVGRFPRKAEARALIDLYG